MRILLIEDDAEAASYLTRAFTEAGHVCDVIHDGRHGLIQATTEDYDVLVIDRMLPRLDGLSILKTLRAAGNFTPTIFLTALGNLQDRVSGFDAGGDDYLVKPFAFAELLARVTALARRPRTEGQSNTLSLHDLSMDLLTRKVVRGGVVLSLNTKEYALLEVLMRNAGRVVSRTMLLEQVWDFHFDPKTSVVETHLSRLRAKIDKPFDLQLLHTIRNVGYSLRVE